MAARSTWVILDNLMVNDFALDLVHKDLDHGVWTQRPPDLAGNHAEWGSESNGFLTGTEGNVFYGIADGGSNLLELKLSWDNPFVGSNSYSQTAAPPGQADGTGFTVGKVVSGSSNHPTVRYILTSGQCSIDAAGRISSFYPLYASLWEKRDGPRLLVRHGLTEVQHRQLINELHGQDFRPKQVSAYDVNGTALFASIWEQGPGPARIARHDLGHDEHQALFNDMLGQGWRLIDISGYSSGDRPLYASIWEELPGPDWQARHGLSAEQHQQAFVNLTREDYRLVHLCGYNVSGTELYASIYEKRGGPEGFARHRLTIGQLKALKERFPRHRCVCISGYSIAGRDRYAGIWEKIELSAPASAMIVRLTAAEHQAECDDRVTEGYRPFHVCGYGLR